MNLNKALSFDDILLIPKTSILKSRSEADLHVNFLGFDIDTPVMSANMESITGIEMALQMYSNGGVGVLNRFLPFDQQIHFCKHYNIKPKIVSVGLNFEKASQLVEAGAHIICLDIAHADSLQTHSFVLKFLQTFPNFPIIIGNYADPWGTFTLKSECNNFWHDNIAFKVGIGGGSMCSTRLVTGFGMPTLESLLWFRAANNSNPIIADGGIKNTGDMAKCFAAGAQMVMCGSLFAGARETPGKVIDNKKIYYGSASYIQKNDYKHIEGVSTYVEYKGPVSQILESIKDGLKSAISYGGAEHIYELRYCQMIEISSSGYKESTPHGNL